MGAKPQAVWGTVPQRGPGAEPDEVPQKLKNF